MANKFIIEGAAFNGDGTSSAEATSNGGVGAWNTITYFEGATPAYGSIAAGDKVFIRSKSKAETNITRIASASINLGVSVATSASWVTWIIDNGVVWPGVSGVIKYELPSTFTVTFRNYNAVHSLAEDGLVLKETNSNIDGKVTVNFGQWHFSQNILVDLTANQHVGGCYAKVTSDGSHTWEGLHLKLHKHYSTAFDTGLNGVLISPHIELTSPNAAARLGVQSYGGRCTIYGGKITGETANATLFALAEISSGFTLIGTEVPKNTKTLSAPPAGGGWRIEAVGLDGGLGSILHCAWGVADTREDSYAPTLNAYADFSVDRPWAWRVYPQNSSNTRPFMLPVEKVYTEAASTKTIIAEVLLADSFINVNKSSLWITVEYTEDASGLKRSVTSRDLLSGSLDTSTASWTVSSYGSTNMIKRKLQVVTPTSIKQDSVIVITLCGTIKSATETDLLFFCPDVVLS